MSRPVPSAAVAVTAAVTASRLSRRFGGGPAAVDALRDVCLTVAAGSFTAVMGPSGLGKSTLPHCLSGLDAPTSGQLFLGEAEITGMSERELTRVRRERTGFVFRAFNLLPALTGRENIVLPLRLAGPAC
jgi:putative ABC transport system ATP-binding protein